MTLNLPYADVLSWIHVAHSSQYPAVQVSWSWTAIRIITLCFRTTQSCHMWTMWENSTPSGLTLVACTTNEGYDRLLVSHGMLCFQCILTFGLMVGDGLTGRAVNNPNLHQQTQRYSGGKEMNRGPRSAITSQNGKTHGQPQHSHLESGCTTQ